MKAMTFGQVLVERDSQFLSAFHRIGSSLETFVSAATGESPKGSSVNPTY